MHRVMLCWLKMKHQMHSLMDLMRDIFCMPVDGEWKMDYKVTERINNQLVAELRTVAVLRTATTDRADWTIESIINLLER